MSVNLSFYDVTQVDWIADTDNNAVPASGAWKPFALQYKRAAFGIGEERIEHRGNLQTLSIDKQVKKWGTFELELLMLKFELTPLHDWWDIVKNAFYNTAAEPAGPALRPGTVSIGAKLNYATPEYWTQNGCKLQDIVLNGSFVTGHAGITLRGIGRNVTLNTTNYVSGAATRNPDPTKTPIVPASDITILLDAIDRTTELHDFTLTLSRTYQQRGRDSANGALFREFIPEGFDGRLEVRQDPLRTEHLTKFIGDTPITCEIQVQNTTNGKKIQFTAAKHKGSEQEHAEGTSPSIISMRIDGSTFNVTTI